MIHEKYGKFHALQIYNYYTKILEFFKSKVKL